MTARSDHTEQASVEIVAPLGRLPNHRFPLASRLESLEGITLGLLDNAKPNANHLLRAIAGQLERDHGVARVVEFGKNVSGVPASPEAVEGLAKECAVVLTGSGD